MLANPAALRVLPSAIVFLCALPAHAVVTTFEPYEQLSTTDVRAVLTDRFHRPQFDGVGATARFQEPLFVDENGDGRLQPEEYQVKAGESWTWIWRVLALDNVPTAGPFVWASVTSVYQGEPTRCFSNTPFCGSFLAGIRFTMTDKCIPEGDWEIELLHNDVSIGKQAFRPARFAPKPSIYAPFADTIEPVIPGQTAARHATGVRVRVEDDLGCGRPLNDVTVRFANTIATSGDHGHAHFSASEGGTGNYSCAFGFPCTLIDDGQDPEDTIVEGKTRTDDLFGPGAFVADYRARELGVRETIKLSLKREATAKDPEVTAPEVETELQIRYPGLVPVDAGPISAVANYGTGCPHDPVPSWMTIYSAANLADVAIEYKRLTGRQLSLNDASLPYGGLFDNRGGAGRNSRCHASHRVGVDIDINSQDDGGVFVRCNVNPSTGQPTVPGCQPGTYTRPDGRAEPLMEFVTNLFAREGAIQLPEGQSIHFRFAQ
jgi:hypothetical protein